MSTKFFTNNEDNTVIDKFAGVFKHNPSIREFDVLVGYFRASGYFNLRPHLDGVEKIRILVGINVDALTQKYHSKGLQLFSADDDEVCADYQHKFKEEINDIDYSKKLEDSILQFVSDIKTKKIEIRAHPTRQLHAKIYIFRPTNFNPDNHGEVITGSSNLTNAGIGASPSSNYEFNVSLRDYDDIKFATDEFEKLWDEGVAIVPSTIDTTINDSFLGKYTPFELYIKLLIEYFGSEIEFDPSKITDLPAGFMKLNYQLDAVEQGYEMIKNHNGMFLADVVGLGKTVIAVLIARKYFYLNSDRTPRPYTLIVTPPAIKDNWKETVEKFNLENVDYITTGSLHKVVAKAKKYDLVIVDESHKFRNDGSDAYKNLQIICKTPNLQDNQKKVLLVSATPLNNRPGDIQNQLLLFQDGHDSTLEVGDINRFFAPLNKQYNDIMRGRGKDTDEVTPQQKTRELYASVREKIIEPITVRRTRRDLMENELYSEDLKNQGIQFPKVNGPENLTYQLSTNLETLYEETLQDIVSSDKKGLLYMRYRAIEFLNPEHQVDYQRPEHIALQLTAIMRTLLVKRMDSSFHAFHKTVQRFIEGSSAMLKMVDNNQIIIASDKKVNEYINDDRVDELIIELEQDMLIDPSIKILERKDFNPEFMVGLKHDHKILLALEKKWSDIIEKDIDPKRDALQSAMDEKLLNQEKNPNQKLVIFSESVDTTNYLAKHLGNTRQDILAINSKNRKARKDDIKANFDANIPLDAQKSDYNIIITTEALAEGINLHRSNSILNYDTPWNSTRLMQRIGRINRINRVGNAASDIYVYNFLPVAKVEADIGLQHRAFVKLQAFHSALGEDSKIYLPEEQTESYSLFDEDINADEEINERLLYLQEIRKFRQQSEDEYKRIKNMPLKMRNGVNNAKRAGSTLIFLRSDKRKSAFYDVGIDNENGDSDNNNNEFTCVETTFMETAKVLKCAPDAKAIALPASHHAQVELAISKFSQDAQVAIIKKQFTQSLTIQQQTALNYLAAMDKLQLANESDKEKIKLARQSIREGRFNHLVRDINKFRKSTNKAGLPDSKVLASLMKIIDKYPAAQPVETSQQRKGSEKPSQLSVVISQSYQ